MSNPNNDSSREAARLARNAYAREWRRKNPEKAKAYAENYWLRVAEKRNSNAERESDENG